MVKISPETFLTERKVNNNEVDYQSPESKSCPNFAQKMCLQIEYTPAQDDMFKTPITKAIKKDRSPKTCQKMRSQHLLSLTKKESKMSAMSMNTPNQDE